MNKSLSILILTVFLSKGVESVSLTDEDYEMADKLFTMGAEGTDMQDLWTSVKELIERISAKERVKGHDDFIVALCVFQRLSRLYGEGLSRLLEAFPENEIFRAFGMFEGIIKNETMVELWKYVESRFLPGAPPIYSDPVGFLGHLLSKKMAQPHVVEILKVALEVVKLDISQLFDEAQMAIRLVKEKAMEISTLERQTEKDEFLITLRKYHMYNFCHFNSVVIPFYSRLLPAKEKHMKGLKISGSCVWVMSFSLCVKSITVERKTVSEQWHCVCDCCLLITLTNSSSLSSWADERFGDLFDNAALEYDRYGNGIFGDDRFNQSNWAIMKMVTIYPLPVYERLSESGLGMSEVNDFFIGTEDTLTKLVDEDILSNLKGMLNELWNIFSNEILHISINKKNQITSDVESEDPLRHLRKMKATCFDIWDRVLTEINRHYNKYGLEQSARQWDEVKSIFIKELTHSGELTQQKLDEAHKGFNNVTQMVFDKYVKMVDGLEERITASTETLGKLMLLAFSATNSVLVNTLFFLLSD
ncbi:unnamed protein product [Leuciscus chuanchicus]